MTNNRTAYSSLTVGILALQGAYEAHAKTLAALNVTTRLIRTPDQLFTPGGTPSPEGTPSIDGLIIPGGESTTMLKFLERNGFLESLSSLVQTLPTFGTCAGAILLANDVQNPPQISLAALDITIERNAYGRQIDSTILTTRDDFPVLVRQGHLLAATFHPELGHDLRVHQLFLDLIASHRIGSHATVAS